MVHLKRLGFLCSGFGGESFPEWGEEWVRDAGGSQPYTLPHPKCCCWLYPLSQINCTVSGSAALSLLDCCGGDKIFHRIHQEPANCVRGVWPLPAAPLPTSLQGCPEVGTSGPASGCARGFCRGPPGDPGWPQGIGGAGWVWGSLGMLQPSCFCLQPTEAIPTPLPPCDATLQTR